MPRIARIVAVGCPHHITQRGNNKQNIFEDRVDYLHYLTWLEEFANRCKLSVIAYCLMPNHVHLVVVPFVINSLSNTFNACHMRYSQYLNRKRISIGHIWQARFHSCVLDEKHLYAAIRYVETNPVRAKLVKRVEDWEWSSARAHLNKGKGILSLAKISDFLEIHDWEAYLALNQGDVIEKIRAHTLSGRPLGDDGFIAKLEEVYGRRLRPMQRGRKKAVKTGTPEAVPN